MALILNGKIFQLTLESKIGFVYDRVTFEKEEEFTIPTKEGWGITTDGISLIISDGTNKLTYLDPNSFQVIKTTSVTENGSTKDLLNELEYISGFIYANIWQTNMIAKIDPASGKIVGKLDLSSLASEAKSIYPGSLEMNGIAFNPSTGKILITGKMWPRIYEITIDLKKQPPT